MKETSREKRVAETTVKPNWRKNCPTCPDMRATGVKTTTSTRVMAMAARPISARPLIAARRGGSPLARWR